MKGKYNCDNIDFIWFVLIYSKSDFTSIIVNNKIMFHVLFRASLP
jgi:hypothetical protein